METYSVLMAVWRKDQPEYLRQSIRSMMEQTIRPDEMIIVEDGPLSRPLYEVLKECRQTYDSVTIKTIRLKKNKGLGQALNTGLRHCSNELVARMDADDIALPVRCEKQLACFARNHNLAVAGTQICEFVNNPGEFIPSRIVPVSQEEILKFARRRSPFNHPTVMYKKSKVLACGGYGTAKRKEDLELFLTMLYQGYETENTKEALLFYRADADNLKRRKEWKNCWEYIRIIYKFYQLGFSSFWDFIYVLCGQTAMHFLPQKLTHALNRKFLRK